MLMMFDSVARIPYRRCVFALTGCATGNEVKSLNFCFMNHCAVKMRSHKDSQ